MESEFLILTILFNDCFWHRAFLRL